jgi:hypothetical protein
MEANTNKPRLRINPTSHTLNNQKSFFHHEKSKISVNQKPANPKMKLKKFQILGYDRKLSERVGLRNATPEFGISIVVCMNGILGRPEYGIGTKYLCRFR